MERFSILFTFPMCFFRKSLIVKPKMNTNTFWTLGLHYVKHNTSNSNLTATNLKPPE
ncbi:hypothetical protein Bhyg_13150 [Pseudolycoriella hygida]|uniref:Uncharacterized protein n=1 Tax=Pseudolycoriella hygida TaxID=35572 RepID=A0A9Q0MMT1_9DIPT|nr:hypothetical protein Bhyg_13150 [Pseudolycoriella hygida]